MEASTQPGTEAQRRKRAAFVCRICRGRKVKCSISDTGRPCKNCKRDGLKCDIAVGRGYRAMAWNHKLQSLLKDNLPGEGSRSVERGSEEPVGPQDLTPERERSHLLQENEVARGNVEAVNISDLNISADTNCRVQTLYGDRDEGENSAAYAATLDEVTDKEDTVPFYIGDHRGSGFVTGTVDLGQCSNGTHFLIPRPSIRMPPEEDLCFLRAKGVFTLPEQSVVAAILRCYFSYVHPILPIINPTVFLMRYETNEPRETSLLLLWSMMFAASNFVDRAILVSAGYESRKAMKRSVYERVKALYNADFENDKIALIQSVMLMSFWNADVEARTGSWHWNGVAISLCHSLGMHRAPRPGLRSQKLLSDDECRLWRLIWWSCFSREVWLSLALGRPMRISADDCDIPLSSLADAEDLVVKIPDEIMQKYFPGCISTLLCMWEKWLKLTMALGEILSTCYRPNIIKWPRQKIEKKEAELRRVYMSSPDVPPNEDSTVLIYQYQVELCFEAIIITLYRPYISDGSTTETPESSFRSIAIQRARIAASNSNGILNKLTSADMIQMCHSYTVTTLLPVMQIHLLEIVSPNSLNQRVAQYHLDMCIIVLEELRKTYWGADFAFKFFTAVRQRLVRPRQLDVDCPGVPFTNPSELEPLLMTVDACTDIPEDRGHMSQTILFEELNPFRLASSTMNLTSNAEYVNWTVE